MTRSIQRYTIDTGHCRESPLSERCSPADLQRLIADDEDATARVLNYLDARCVTHSGRISGATLASVCDVDGRQWRRWVGGDAKRPRGALRLLVLVAGLEWPQNEKSPQPKLRAW